MSVVIAEGIIALVLALLPAAGAQSATACRSTDAPPAIRATIYAALIAAGRNPAGVYAPAWSWGDGNRVSNCRALSYVAWYESRYRPAAYNETDYPRAVNWGARGLFQITRRWVPEASDAQAFSPQWAALYAVSRLDDLHAAWPQAYRALDPTD